MIHQEPARMGPLYARVTSIDWKQATPRRSRGTHALVRAGSAYNATEGVVLSRSRVGRSCTLRSTTYTGPLPVSLNHSPGEAGKAPLIH